MPSWASSAQAFIVEPAHAGEHTSGLFSQDGVGEGCCLKSSLLRGDSRARCESRTHRAVVP
jgi:hypothetical protein